MAVESGPMDTPADDGKRPEGQDFNTAFGVRLREVRNRKGWTMSRLAQEMERSGWRPYRSMNVKRTEEGRAVRLDEALALARALGTSLDDLAGIESSQIKLEMKTEEKRNTLVNVSEELSRWLGLYFSAAMDADGWAYAIIGSEDLGASLVSQLHSLIGMLNGDEMVEIFLRAFDEPMEGAEFAARDLQFLSMLFKQLEQREISGDLDLLASVGIRYSNEVAGNLLETEIWDAFRCAHRDPARWWEARRLAEAYLDGCASASEI